MGKTSSRRVGTDSTRRRQDRRVNRPRVRLWTIVSRAVDEGVAYGLRRVDKYRPRPLDEATREAIEEHVSREVMNALSEVVDFGE